MQGHSYILKHYTHLHSCTTSTLMYYSDRCQPVGPVTPRLRVRVRVGIRPYLDADESWRDESRQSRTVTTVTWMSHGVMNPTLMSHGGNMMGTSASAAIKLEPGPPSSLGQHAGSPYWRGTRCGVQNSVAKPRNVPCAHLATCQAQAVPIYRPDMQEGL